MRRFKKGDKIKIPTKKSNGYGIDSWVRIHGRKAEKCEYMFFYSYMEVEGKNLCFLRFDMDITSSGGFLESDLEPYNDQKVGW